MDVLTNPRNSSVQSPYTNFSSNGQRLEALVVQALRARNQLLIQNTISTSSQSEKPTLSRCAFFISKLATIRDDMYSKFVNAFIVHHYSINAFVFDLAVTGIDGCCECLELLQEQFDPNFQDPTTGQTALILAACNGHDHIITKLHQLYPTIDPNLADSRTQSTALMFASARGHDNCVKALFAFPQLDLGQQNHYGDTALMLAAALNNAHKCISQMGQPHNWYELPRVLEFDGRSRLASQALSVAVRYSNDLSITALGRAFRVDHTAYKRALVDAIDSGNRSCVTALLGFPSISQSIGQELLMDAAAASPCPSEFLSKLEHHFFSQPHFDNIDFNYQHPITRQTALMQAIIYHNHSFISQLKSQRDKVNLKLQDDQGRTAIIHAALSQDNKMFTLLSEFSKDVGQNILDKHGFTALTYLVHFGDSQGIEVLRSLFMINPCPPDNNGLTPFLHLFLNGHHHCLPVLHRILSINPWARDLAGNTALMLAAQHGRAGCIEKLAELLPNIITRFDSSFSHNVVPGEQRQLEEGPALLLAVLHNHIPCIDALCKGFPMTFAHGGYVLSGVAWAAVKKSDAFDSESDSGFHIYKPFSEENHALAALSMNLHDIYDQKAGSIINWQDKEGLSPLMINAKSGDVGIMRDFEDNFPDIDYSLRSKDGRTALMHAVASNSTDFIVEFLYRCLFIGNPITSRLDHKNVLYEWSLSIHRNHIQCSQLLSDLSSTAPLRKDLRFLPKPSDNAKEDVGEDAQDVGKDVHQNANEDEDARRDRRLADARQAMEIAKSNNDHDCLEILQSHIPQLFHS